MKLSHKIALTYIRTKLGVLSLLAPAKAARQAFELFCTPRKKKEMPVSPILTKAGQLTLITNGYSLHGYQWNKGGSKKILIVHGFESTAANFDRYAAKLVKKGYEVVAFDAQAHGKSAGTTITLPEYVQTLQQICHQYGSFDGYIAHSFGGLALAHLLEQVPHHPNTKAVLIAPATETVSAIRHFFTLLRVNNRIKQPFEKLVAEKGGRPAEYYSIRRAIKHIQARVLWLHDRDDDITPFSDAETVQNDNNSNLQFIATQGLGHRKIYRDESVMKQILDFL
ncbi:MAG: alpha/beta hydrolase [Agriterribacter sp.]